MSLPLALVNASGESRDRSGPITVTPSDANVDVTGDAWRLWLGLGTDPTLHLSPNISRDQSGSVSLDFSGIANYEQIVTGEHGPAWLISADPDPEGWSIGNFRVDNDGYISRHTGTMIGRVSFGSPEGRGSVQSAGAPGQGGEWRLYGGRDAGNSRFSYSMGNPLSLFPDATMPPDDTLTAVAFRWENGSGNMAINGVSVGTNTHDVGDTDPARFYTSLTGQAYNIRAEGWVFYPDWIDDSRMSALSTIPRRWEWGPPGTLAIPLAQAPASVIVRSRDSGVSVTEVVVMQDGSATFADGTGTLSHADGELTVGTTRNVDVEGVIAYPDVVSEGVVQRVAGMETWTWSGLQDRVGGIIRISLPEPLAIGRAAGTSPISIARVGGSQHG